MTKTQKAVFILCFFFLGFVNQGHKVFSAAKNNFYLNITALDTFSKEILQASHQKVSETPLIKVKYKKKRGKGVENTSAQFLDEIKHNHFYFAEIIIPCLQTCCCSDSKNCYSDRAPPLKD